MADIVRASSNTSYKFNFSFKNNNEKKSVTVIIPCSMSSTIYDNGFETERNGFVFIFSTTDTFFTYKKDTFCKHLDNSEKNIYTAGVDIFKRIPQIYTRTFLLCSLKSNPLTQ